MHRIAVAMENHAKDWDVVDQASWESFPASDPPGWGSFRAVPSATTCGGARPRRAKDLRVARAGFGWVVAIALTVSLGVLHRVLRR